MANYILFDGPQRDSLLPLTYMRAIGDILVGMYTIRQKWQKHLNVKLDQIVPSYLSGLYKSSLSDDDKVYINSACLPNIELIGSIGDMRTNQCILSNGKMVALKTKKKLNSSDQILNYATSCVYTEISAKIITNPEDILESSRSEFLNDCQHSLGSFSTIKPDESIKTKGTDIYYGKGISAFDVTLNASDGPIVIADDVELMESSVIKGPAFIGPSTKIHVGAKVYADTYLGPQCRIGGEVKRTVMFGYSNKGHDGFLGDSVLSKWCNLGADTNCSNMKNTYGLVSLYDIEKGDFRTTKKQFLGMILGDHTMSAINTSFNTGTITGVFCNVLDKNPPRYIQSFSWGSDAKFDLDKAIQIATHAMSRRNIQITQDYIDLIRYLGML